MVHLGAETGVEIETLPESSTNNTRAQRDRIVFKLLKIDTQPGKDDTENAHVLKISLPGGHMFQLEVISLVHTKFYKAPEDPASTARFRFAPDHAEGNDAEAQTSADRKFAEFVEVATTILDLEIASERMPSTEDVFNSIDLIGEDDGNLLVGFVPPEDNAVSDFRFVSDATLSRQRWRWTGRSSGVGSPKDSNGNADADADKLDLRRLSKRVWEDTAGLLENAANDAPVRGMRRNGRAVLEPRYAVVTNDPDRPEMLSLNGDGSAEAVKSWQDLIETDGEWFAAIPDTDRFDETDSWPTLIPPGSAFGDETATALRTRGLVLARIPLTDRPQAQYWRFAAILRSRYSGLMHRDHRDRISSCPWRRVILRPDYTDRTGQEPPAPRLRLIIPLPGPIEPIFGNASAVGSSSDSLQEMTSNAWSSFLAVFDETWGEVAGLAEYIEAWVAPTTASDEEVGAQTSELTAIFAPVHEIPEFGFDPILRGDNPLRGIEFEPGTDRYPYVHTDGSPIGLTFENARGSLRSTAPARRIDGS